MGGWVRAREDFLQQQTIITYQVYSSIDFLIWPRTQQKKKKKMLKTTFYYSNSVWEINYHVWSIYFLAQDCKWQAFLSWSKITKPTPSQVLIPYSVKCILKRKLKKIQFLNQILSYIYFQFNTSAAAIMSAVTSYESVIPKTFQCLI